MCTSGLKWILQGERRNSTSNIIFLPKDSAGWQLLVLSSPGFQSFGISDKREKEKGECNTRKRGIETTECICFNFNFFITETFQYRSDSTAVLFFSFSIMIRSRWLKILKLDFQDFHHPSKRLLASPVYNIMLHQHSGHREQRHIRGTHGAGCNRAGVFAEGCNVAVKVGSMARTRVRSHHMPAASSQS